MKQKHPIKHIWFDLSDTLAVYSDEFNRVHEELLHSVYGDAVKKPVTEELKHELKELRQHHGSISKVFHALGLPSNYWHDHFAKLNPLQYFEPDEHIRGTLEKIRKIIPVSLFTNARPQAILNAIGIDIGSFTNVIDADQLTAPKPDPSGFKLMIEKSGLPVGEILYVGDDVKKDILPAKSLGIQTAMMWNISDEADYSFEHFEDILNLFK